MKILYLGEDANFSTSFHRASALTRIGHEVEILNPYEILRNDFSHFLKSKIHFRTGYYFLQRRIEKWLQIKFVNISNIYDLIWIDGGELFGLSCLKIIKSINIPVILYNIDDPTGKRDGHRFKSLISALSFYDLVVVVRKESRDECLKLGAKNVLLVNRSYDEIAHKPYVDSNKIPLNFKSDVAFIGTWMRHEKRDEFILKLINSGIHVSIWGDRWEKSKHWDKIKPVFRGNSLGGIDYVAAIQGAKICIGMLSKGNRDQITTRSLEIPFAGGLLCAERTNEHLELFREEKEALFWDDINECVSICKRILNDEKLREKIRLNGMQKVRNLKVGNEDICQLILEEIIGLQK